MRQTDLLITYFSRIVRFNLEASDLTQYHSRLDLYSEHVISLNLVGFTITMPCTFTIFSFQIQ